VSISAGGRAAGGLTHDELGLEDDLLVLEALARSGLTQQELDGRVADQRAVAGHPHVTSPMLRLWPPRSWARTAHGTIEVEAVVPPNTTAEVRLPGATESIQVGSGSHSWTVQADAVPPVPGDVSLSSDLSDVIDAPDAYGS
jgi:hypothetical protein